MRRPIRIDGDVAYIPLTQGHEAIIDSADLPLVDGRNWYALVLRRADGSVWGAYAVRTHLISGKKKMIYLHRAIMNAPDQMEIDHSNGNGLDNRRANLRVATHAQNQRNQKIPTHNTSGFKGASWHRAKGRWHARIVVTGKVRHLGYFTEIADAAAAYATASRELHGEFGRIK